MKHLASLSLITFTIGCSAGPGFTSVDEGGGAGGEPTGIAGQTNVGGGNPIGIGLTGSGNDTSSVGGNSAIGGNPATGGNPGGNPAGGENSAGNGGNPAGGENSAGSANGGNGNTGTTCIPKTCLTIAVELAGTTEGPPDACGIVEDGCGNVIDCGGCVDPLYGSHSRCGLTFFADNDFLFEGTTHENLCAPACVRSPSPQNSDYGCAYRTWEVTCVSNHNELPWPGCTLSNTSRVFCCPN